MPVRGFRRKTNSSKHQQINGMKKKKNARKKDHGQ
jgi:hypothetical protein